MTKKTKKTAKKSKLTKAKRKQTKLEKSDDGTHERLPEVDHYRLLFMESKVKEAKTKLSEQRVSYDLWRLETARKQERLKATVQAFANKARDAEAHYNNELVTLTNKYGINWNEVALQDDGTIIPLNELPGSEEVEEAASIPQADQYTPPDGGNGESKQPT